MKRLGMALAIATIIACQSEKKTDQTIDSATNALQPSTDSISFKYDSVKVYSTNPVSADARVTDTAKAVISYPVFTDSKLNDFVLKKITGTVDAEKTYSSYDSYAKGFIKDFDSFQKENPDRIQTWFLTINTKVIKQNPQYIAFYTTYINFSGGAHPNSSFTYQNYNPVTHQKIILDSLLLPGSNAKLNAIAENIFRKNEKLTPDQSLKNSYFFENDTFKLNDNFTVTDEGLLFLYNPYEIKAYAFGITKLLIPFSELKDIAKPKSLISLNN
ncbi:DUF3298 domain-containing protein [Pedobacter sp. JCM 36344]|uniref:DUF3298 and DUF4163 domain-containing protein n=1 Tax=Pedobacter sp. JCM 36344 TaxID=3374280 RepID=UPI00397D9F74